MKSKFTTVDIIAMVAELNDRLAGMRVAQVYDADHKTYLLKLQRPEHKAVLLLESGARIHATEYEWPKNPAPSGFSMKLRKHIRNKRLESIRQLGVDRVVDLQFGSGEVAHHVILELYDRGNLVLTDNQYTILNILRPRTDAESVRFASKENYPLEKARMYETRSEQQLREIVTAAKEGEMLKKVINPHLDFGSALIEHLLLEAGFPAQTRIGQEFCVENDMHRLVAAVRAGEAVLRNEQQDFKGIVTYRVERRSAGGQKTGSGGVSGEDTEVLSYQEFHPLLYVQHAEQPHHTFLSFTSAVDEYFSKLESQKLDMKAVQQERDALKKLDNVRRDHQRRLEALELAQRDDRWRAELITSNAQLVNGAALVVRSALANQIDWREIGRIVQEAQKRADPVARAIKALKLEANHITMLLHDPYQEESEEEEEEEEEEDGSPPAEKTDQSSSTHIRPMLVDIDLDLSALANATRYFGQKRTAAKKQQKTVESSFKAMKSAEQKTKQTLKEAATIASINKARRVHWFEKFIWFISSENYLVIGGRDQQQNEILVRRYLKPGDVYVHGDLHGAASLVVKNPGGGEVPPKTLNEAGSFAVCNSSAWDAKIVTSAWWVYAHQVSKTAPTGEYLTTGSFMVRGKKNPLPPCHLVLGFGVLFKLEESSLERHRGERRVRTVESEDTLRSLPSGETREAPSSPAGTADNGEDSGGAAAQEDGSSQEDTKDGEDGEKEGEEKEDSDEVEEKGDSDEEKEKDSEAEEEEAKAESEEENEFPDTNVEVKHLKGSKFTVEVTSPTDSRPSDNPFPALPGPKPAARRGGKKPTGPPSAGKEKKQNCAPPPQPRGKRSKMKRAMEKYKDQDDEEREARMAILQSAGRCHAAVAEEKRQQEHQEKQERVQQQQQRREQLKAKQEAAEDDADDEEVVVPQDCQILDEFTGIPVDEDELLYAIPVCAPWSTALTYKFKVKLTPSGGKKGKAAKTAVQSFLADKAASPRERDLIKSVRMEDVTRNFPGRVKVVMPQAARAKKK